MLASQGVKCFQLSRQGDLTLCEQKTRRSSVHAGCTSWHRPHSDVGADCYREFEHEAAAVAPTLPDYTLFKNLPSAGAQLAPRLLTAFGEQREQSTSADELQK
jgi:hypothetical protein